MRRRFVSFTGAILLCGLVPPIVAASSSAAMPLLGSCQVRTDQVDAFSYRFCSAFLPSFDGVPLDGDLTLAAGTTPHGGYPLIVMMHGWGNSKTD